MERRPLGKTGLTVSALGFGCGAVGGLMTGADATAQRECVARALDAGFTYFDTASSYGAGRSEENLGRVLRELAAWERVVVGTKVRLTGADLADPAGAIRRSLTASLARLGREGVDLLHLHNPLATSESGLPGRDVVPVAAVRDGIAEGLRAVVREGLARHAGFTGLGETEAVLDAVRSGTFQTVQCYVNAINPSAAVAGASGGAQDFAGVIPTAAGAGLGVLAIRVLAAGALAGLPERQSGGGRGAPLAGGGEYGADLERASRLAPLARDLGLDGLPELAVRFALAQPGVSTVLLGYSNAEQLADVLPWAERGPLPPTAVQEIVAAAR
jgi:L-galactose dehydrogenase/L-glyceraldehyde 3-phosphate reductase